MRPDRPRAGRNGARRRYSPAQSRAARALLGCSLEWLADAAAVEPEALSLFESGDADLDEDELDRLGAAIREAGVVPIAAARAGEGVRLRMADGGTLRDGSRAALARDSRADWLRFGSRRDGPST